MTMAPRREEDDPAKLAVARRCQKQPASPHSVTSNPKLLHKSSFSMDTIEDLGLNMELPTAVPSLEQLSERTSAFLKRLDSKPNSILVKACRESLVSEISFMLTEARLLAENTGEAATTTVPYKLSLLKIHVQTYLEMIETALEHPTLNSDLQAVLSSMTVLPEKTARISPWTIPSLAFEVTAATPIQYEFKPCNNTHIPLTVNVSAIVEVLAAELASSSNVVSQASRFPSCNIVIEKCFHNTPTFKGAAVVGSAVVGIKLIPLKELQQSEKCRKRWGVDSDAESVLHIKEARCVQTNAFPPQPRANVDLFTSSTFGEGSISISFSFQTSKTLKDETPLVNIELVME